MGHCFVLILSQVISVRSLTFQNCWKGLRWWGMCLEWRIPKAHWLIPNLHNHAFCEHSFLFILRNSIPIVSLKQVMAHDHDHFFSILLYQSKVGIAFRWYLQLEAVRTLSNIWGQPFLYWRGEKNKTQARENTDLGPCHWLMSPSHTVWRAFLLAAEVFLNVTSSGSTRRELGRSTEPPPVMHPQALLTGPSSWSWFSSWHRKMPVYSWQVWLSVFNKEPYEISCIHGNYLTAGL